MNFDPTHNLTRELKEAGMNMEQARRRHEDAVLIQDLQAWPQWPWLPMKRYANGKLEHALMHADNAKPPDEPRIYRTNLFDVKHYFPTAEMQFKAYASINDLQNDGWQVD